MGVTIKKSQQQQNHCPRTDSSPSHWGPKRTLLVPNLRPRFCRCRSTRNVQLAWRPSNECNVSSWRNTLIKLTHHDETKQRAHDPQRVRAKENLKLSHGGSSHRQAPGTTDQSSTPEPPQSLRPDPPSCNQRGNHSHEP